MKKLGISSTVRKKRRYYGKSGSIVFPNLLQRNFSSSASRCKLATDITYLPTQNGFIYLSAVQDLCNNEIVVYSLSARNDLDLVLATIRQLDPMPGAVLHSDQGFQYTHKSYQQELDRLKILGSHSRRATAWITRLWSRFFPT